MKGQIEEGESRRLGRQTQGIEPTVKRQTKGREPTVKRQTQGIELTIKRQTERRDGTAKRNNRLSLISWEAKRGYFFCRTFSNSSFSLAMRSKCSRTREYVWLFTCSSVSPTYFCIVATVAVYTSKGDTTLALRATG